MATYELISKSLNTSGNVTTVTFSSIPSTYTDLKLVACGRGSIIYSGDSNYTRVRPNNVTTGYTQRYLTWNQSNVYSATNTTGDGFYTEMPASGITAGLFGNGEIYMFDYASTTSFKPSLSWFYGGNESTTVYFQGQYAVVLRSNSAISSLTIQNVNGDFVTNSNFYLYGIKNTNT